MIKYLQSPEVISSLIHCGAVIIAALIAAASALLISNQLKSRNRLEQKYLTALNDLYFLLAAEEIYCQEIKTMVGALPKRRVRRNVSKQRSLEWSGRLSPARIRSEKERIKYSRNIRTSSEW